MLKVPILRDRILPIFASIMSTVMLMGNLSAQQNSHYLRIAKIVVDSSQLENYKSALKEGISAAVREEPGVLGIYAVYDKSNPTHITVFEIYAGKDAYNAHVQTAHFRKYKSTVEHMVKSLELEDVEQIAMEARKGVF